MIFAIQTNLDVELSMQSSFVKAESQSRAYDAVSLQNMD
jgi:hypothetical protein